MRLRSSIIMLCLASLYLTTCSPAQAQSTEGKYEEYFTFLARSTGDVNVDKLEAYLKQPSYNSKNPDIQKQTFTLLPVLTAPGEDKPWPKNALEFFANPEPSAKLFQLSDKTDSFLPCDNLVLGRVKVDQIPDGTTLQQLADALKNVPPDVGIQALGVDTEGKHNDMAISTAEASQDAFQTAVTHPDESGNPSYSEQGSNTIIAILDTGVTTDGEVGSLTILPSQVDLINVDGKAEDVYEDYMNGSSMNKGHGTPIALVAHKIAPKAEILPIRVCNEEGQCPMASVVVGICYAVNVATSSSKTLVMNMSFSGLLTRGFAPKNTLFYQLLERVISPRVLVATEVGNKGLDTRPRYPAAFSNEGLDGLVSTSALEPYGQGSWQYVPAPYSTRGSYIDVAALGSNLFIGTHVIGDNDYRGGYTGSSFATPWVAGALSLLLEANAQRTYPLQSLTAWELEYCLKSTTQPPMPPVISPQEVGSGMIDISKAVKCVQLFPNYP
jgi:subtilisin family serine protease